MKKRILVVDDERPIVELLKFKLSKRGFEVMTAGNVREFFIQALSERVDLLILDIWLGGWVGTQVYNELLERGFDGSVPVIFITALLDEEMAGRWSGSRGRYALYRKPFDFLELMRELDRMLNEYPCNERRNTDEEATFTDDCGYGDSPDLSLSRFDGIREREA